MASEEDEDEIEGRGGGSGGGGGRMGETGGGACEGEAAVLAAVSKPDGGLEGWMDMQLEGDVRKTEEWRRKLPHVKDCTTDLVCTAEGRDGQLER